VSAEPGAGQSGFLDRLFAAREHPARRDVSTEINYLYLLQVRDSVYKINESHIFKQSDRGRIMGAMKRLWPSTASDADFVREITKCRHAIHNEYSRLVDVLTSAIIA
jgi:hypothetical protein